MNLAEHNWSLIRLTPVTVLTMTLLVQEHLSTNAQASKK